VPNTVLVVGTDHFEDRAAVVVLSTPLVPSFIEPLTFEPDPPLPQTVAI